MTFPEIYNQIVPLVKWSDDEAFADVEYKNCYGQMAATSGGYHWLVTFPDRSEQSGTTTSQDDAFESMVGAIAVFTWHSQNE